MLQAGTLERPSYYWADGVDVIRVIEEYDLGFHIGNALKYTVRAGRKGDERADVAKACEYMRRWFAWVDRPQIRGAIGMDWMHPLKVAGHFGLSDWRAFVVIKLLEGAAMTDEEPRLRDADAALQARLLELGGPL